MQNARNKNLLKNKAYNYIKSKILNCEYMPNELINEVLICEEIGDISRTPVRDALSHLEQEGLVTIIPKKGSFVVGLNYADLNQLYEARSLLEPYAIKKYGHLIPKENLKQFKKEFLASAKHDTDFSYDLDDKFHMTIINSTNNVYFKHDYKRINDSNQRFRIISGKTKASNIKKANSEHVEIINACLKKNWDLAAELMLKHLESSRISAMESFIDGGA